MSLQEVSLDEPHKRKLVRAGDDVLEALDQLHALLLGGPVTLDIIGAVQAKLDALKKLNTSSDVGDVIQEIELRAAVELAKLSRDAP